MEQKRHLFTYGSGRVEIDGLSLGLSPEQFQSKLLEKGFTRSADQFKGDFDGLGTCYVKIYGTDEIGTVIITTERKFSEDEMMEVFKQVEEDLPGQPLYDDGGYGVMPKPHEINHFWDFEKGHVTIHWDGYDYSRSNDSDTPQGDGYGKIAFWLRKPLVKDEEYWRSEAD